MLRLTNGLTNAPPTCCPRLRSASSPRTAPPRSAWPCSIPHLYFLLPDGVCYHGHAVSGGKKTGSGPLALKREPRELTLAAARRGRANSTARRRCSRDLEDDIAGSPKTWSVCAACSRRRRRTPLALDHEMRKMGEEFSRANSRLSVARLELERLCAGERTVAREARRNRAGVAGKEEARAEQEQALAMPARRSRSSSRKPCASVKSTPRSASTSPASKSAAAPSTPRACASKIRSATSPTAASELTQEMERLGVEKRAAAVRQHRARHPRRDSGRTDHRARSQQWPRWQREEAGTAQRAAQRRKRSSRHVRVEVQAASEKRSQIELELVKKQAELKYLDETCRKELNASLEELAAGRRDRPGRATASPKPSSATRKCGRGSKPSAR